MAKVEEDPFWLEDEKAFRQCHHIRRLGKTFASEEVRLVCAVLTANT